jgi:hypothetical protein
MNMNVGVYQGIGECLPKEDYDPTRLRKMAQAGYQ